MDGHSLEGTPRKTHLRRGMEVLRELGCFSIVPHLFPEPHTHMHIRRRFHHSTTTLMDSQDLGTLDSWLAGSCCHTKGLTLCRSYLSSLCSSMLFALISNSYACVLFFHGCLCSRGFFSMFYQCFFCRSCYDSLMKPLEAFHCLLFVFCCFPALFMTATNQ